MSSIPKAEQEAFQAAVAEKLGVTTEELQDAYKAASLEQLDAAVEAGRLTEEQADAIRERIESGDFLGPHGFGFFGGHRLRGAGPPSRRRRRLPRPDRGSSCTSGFATASRSPRSRRPKASPSTA